MTPRPIWAPQLRRLGVEEVAAGAHTQDIVTQACGQEGVECSNRGARKACSAVPVVSSVGIPLLWAFGSFAFVQPLACPLQLSI